jgi:hypothetical protein
MLFFYYLEVSILTFIPIDIISFNENKDQAQSSERN